MLGNKTILIIGTGMAHSALGASIAALTAKDPDLIIVSDIDIEHSEELMKQRAETFAISRLPEIPNCVPIEYAIERKDDYNKQQQKLRNRYNQRRK